MKQQHRQEAIQQQGLAAETDRRAQQQAIVAELGQRALQVMNTTRLMDEAVAVIAQALETKYVKILELITDNDMLVMQAGIGWPDELIGRAAIEMSADSPTTQVLLSGEAAIIENLNQERSYDWYTLLLNQGVASGLRVVIQGKDRPFGILGAYASADQPRRFTQADLYFLRAVANILAMAMERQRVDAEVARRNRELLNFQAASAAITSSLDLEHVLNTLAKEIINLLGVAGCIIYEWNQANDTLTLLFEIGPDSWTADAPIGLEFNPADDHLTKQVLVERIPRQITIHQDDIDPSELAYIQAEGFEVLLMLPMAFQEGVVGLLELVDNQKTRVFNEHEIALAQLLANQAAGAIENARLHAETQRRLAEQTALRKAIAAISSTLELEMVLSQIAEQMALAIEATSAYICSFDPATKTAPVLAEYISPQACLEEQTSDLGIAYVEDDTKFLETLQLNRPTISHIDDPGLLLSEREHLQQHGAQSVLYVPLQIKGQPLGYAELWESRHKREFTPEETALCQDIGQQAAIAIKNAQLHAQIQQRLAEQIALRQAIAVISSTLDLSVILSQIAEQVAQIIDVTSVYICDYEPIKGVVTVIAEHTSPEADEQERVSDLGVSYDTSNEYLDDEINYIKTGQPTQYHADDPRLGEMTREHLQAYGAQTELIIPLKVGNRFIGLVDIWESREKRVFTPNEIALCQAIAQQAAVVVENAQLYDQTQRHTTELEQRVAERTAELQKLNEDLQKEITERKQTEQALRDSEERFRVLAEGTFESLAIHEQGTILEANQNFAEMFGYELADVIGKYALEFTAPESHDLTMQKLRFSSEEPYEAVGLRKDGSKFDVELMGRDIPYQGRPAQVVAIRDITERRQTEATLRHLNEKLQQRVIENGRLFNEEQRQRQMAQSLREVSFALNSSLDQETVLTVIFEQLETVLEYDGAGLFLRKGDSFELYGGRNLPPTFIGRQAPLSGQNLALEPFERKKPVVVADVRCHSRWQSWPGGEKLRAWMGAPLLAQEQVIGVLTLDNFVANAYTEEDAQTLQIFANHAAIAIQNAQFYAAAQQEIAERKQPEEMLAQARDQALIASRLKSELLAKVSHEFRTPLNAILGFSEMLQLGIYGPISDEQQRPISQLIESTYYLTDLVNELLDQAQMDAGKVKLDVQSFVPAGIVSQVYAHMQVLAEAKGLTLTIEIADDVPMTLNGDPARLQQMLMNLVSNAIKFTETGTVEVRLYRPNPSHWAMQVADTGPGIPLEDQTHIFEPFGQVDGSMTRKYGGTGLGLSIVKQLTKLMGGKVILESQVGKGSTFTVLLPLEPKKSDTETMP